MLATLTCHWCRKEFETDARWKLDQARRTGRTYCSRECSRAYSRKVASETMAETNRKYAGERMKRNNPMANPESLEKMRATLKRKSANGFLGQRQGNGSLTAPQMALAMALRWDVEVAIPTGRSGKGYPTCYKVDVGHAGLKIAIEVDGSSHSLRVRKAEDAKKTAFLNSLGWTVLRFWNREVTEDLAGCVQRVWSTISKLSAGTPTPPTGSSCTTATTPPPTPT